MRVQHKHTGHMIKQAGYPYYTDNYLNLTIWKIKGEYREFYIGKSCSEIRMVYLVDVFCSIHVRYEAMLLAQAKLHRIGGRYVHLKLVLFCDYKFDGKWDYCNNEMCTTYKNSVQTVVWAIYF